MTRRIAGRGGTSGSWLRLDASLVCVAGGGPGARSLLGLPIAACVGKPFPGSIPFADGESIAEALRGVLEGSAGAIVVAELLSAGSSRWLELSVSPEGDEVGESCDAAAPSSPARRGLRLRLEDVTARVGEEQRLRAALAAERAVADFACEIVRGSDAGLDEALASGLARIARQLGAERAELVTASPVAPAAHPRRLRCPIPGRSPSQAVEICWPEGAGPSADAGPLLTRHAELLGALLERREQAGRAGRDGVRFQALVDHNRDGICELGEDGRVLYASPSFAASCGVEAEQLLGADFLSCVDVEDRRRVAQMIRPGAHARRRAALVHRLRQRSGPVLFVESTAREFVGADARGRIVVTTRDVTEREQARLALERQIELETRVAELSRFFMDLDVEQTHAGIESQLAVVAGLAEAQHSWLYSFTTGRQGSELFDWWQASHASLPHPSLDASVARFPHSTQLIQSGQIYHVASLDALPPEASSERDHLQARGVRSLLGIPIMSGGRFVGFLGFENYERETHWSEETIMLLRLVGEIFYSCLRRRRAVEELRDSQSQLLQAQKMEAVGTLAGGIAHDFNNHLAVMLGNARFLRQEVDAGADVSAAIEDLERSADHCAKLTRSLLAFSRRSPVQVVPVAVSDVVRGVEALVRPLLPPRFVLETVLGSDLGEFAVDQVQIQQVLVNLLVNARDAMQGGGPIRMAAERRRLAAAEVALEGLDPEREYVVLSVADTGCGMDAETLRRVFEPFFTTKPVGQGTGLGLAMAYGIVRQSGGAIAIESRVGEGTTVRVFLPASAAAGSQGVGAPGAGVRTFAGRAVVHEPDPAVCEMIWEVLSEQGFEVEVARAPERVAELVRRAGSRIELIVAAMPRPNPAPDRFAESMRGGLTGPPVLALADAGPSPIESLDPRVRVLRKPVSRAELRDALEPASALAAEG